MSWVVLRPLSVCWAKAIEKLFAKSERHGGTMYIYILYIYVYNILYYILCYTVLYCTTVFDSPHQQIDSVCFRWCPKPGLTGGGQHKLIRNLGVDQIYSKTLGQHGTKFVEFVDVSTRLPCFSTSPTRTPMKPGTKHISAKDPSNVKTDPNRSKTVENHTLATSECQYENSFIQVI